MRSGLGSKRSTWLGAPSMKQKMTDFARGVTCGVFGASGSADAARASSSIRLARASAARPLPARVKNSRRLETFQWCLRVSNACVSGMDRNPLIQVQEFVRIEQHLAQVDEGRGACGVHPDGHVG